MVVVVLFVQSINDAATSGTFLFVVVVLLATIALRNTIERAI